MLVYLNQALARRRDRARQENRLLGADDVRNAVFDGALLRRGLS